MKQELEAALEDQTKDLMEELEEKVKPMIDNLKTAE